MQGWRNTMEDAHIAELDLGNGVSFFGVYDGHGGKSKIFNFKENFEHILDHISQMIIIG